MAAFDATTWVFKVRRPRNAGSHEAETVVALATTRVKALSINGVGSDVAVAVRSMFS